MHVPVSAASSVVFVIEKSDRNCLELAECTSVRISLMDLLYRIYMEKSMEPMNGITFYVHNRHSVCTIFNLSAFFIK